MELTWLGAAGFKLDTSEGATLLIDPFFSRPAQAYPLLPLRLTDIYPVDEILLTNGRFDHAMDTPALTSQTGALVHATRSICERLAKWRERVGGIATLITDSYFKKEQRSG